MTHCLGLEPKALKGTRLGSERCSPRSGPTNPEEELGLRGLLRSRQSEVAPPARKKMNIQSHLPNTDWPTPGHPVAITIEASPEIEPASPEALSGYRVGGFVAGCPPAKFGVHPAHSWTATTAREPSGWAKTMPPCGGVQASSKAAVKVDTLA